MRLNKLALVTLSAALLVSACGGDEQAAAEDTTDLTASLLAEPPASDGISTPVVDASADLPDADPGMLVAQIGFNRGSAEAPVKVVELSDYGCTYCRKFHEETFPTLLADFIESGMVEWKFVPYITGMWESSVAATEAAECVYVQDTDAFEALNRRLWNEQGTWKQSDAPEPVIRGWASELGIDMAAFDACVARDEQLGRVAASTQLARQLGIRGTPTFVVIGYPPLQGALPLEMFQEVLTLVYNDAVSPTGQ